MAIQRIKHKPRRTGQHSNAGKARTLALKQHRAIKATLTSRA